MVKPEMKGRAGPCEQKKKRQEGIDLHQCVWEESLKRGAWVWSRAGWEMSTETSDRGTTTAEELRVKRRVLEARDQQKGVGMNLGARGREARGGRRP